MVTCNRGVLDEHDRVQEIPYRGGGGDLHVYWIPVCTWLTYNAMIILLDMCLVL